MWTTFGITHPNGLQPRIGISSSKNISPSKGLGTGGITPNKSPRVKGYRIFGHRSTVNAIKLETGFRPNSAGIPYALLLRIEAIGFPTLGLLL